MLLTSKLYTLGKINNGLVDLTSSVLLLCVSPFFLHWENEPTLLKHALRVCIAFLFTYSEAYLLYTFNLYLCHLNCQYNKFI